MTDFDLAVQKIKKLYRGLGWPSVFAKIRFITAPYRLLEREIPPKGLIIDLGCGYGIFSNLLGLLSGKRRILGLDLDKKKISCANRGVNNVDCRFGDITKIDIPPADCILLIHVLHHLDSFQAQEDLLAACFKKLKGGGRLVIAEIDSQPRWKFLLTSLADYLLYPGDKIYYRFPDKLTSILKKFPAEIKVEIMHQGTPFSHITYVCTKR